MKVASLLLIVMLFACSGSGEPVVHVPNPDTSSMEPQVRTLIESWRARTERNPEVAENWGRYGIVLDAHELVVEASAAYQQAHALDPGTFHYAYFLGMMLDMLGRPLEEKLPYFDAAQAIDSNYPPLYLRRGDMLSRDGRLEEARAAYRQALELDPNYLAAHASMGTLLLTLDEAEQALEHLLIVQRVAPRDRPVHVSLARAYTMLGRHDEARTITDRLAGMSIMLGDGDSVRGEVRDSGISSEACFERARQNMDVERWDDAIRELNIVVSSNPQHAAAYSRLGRCYQSKGKPLEAIPHFKSAIDLDSELISARMRLAHAHMVTGQFAEGETVLKAILQEPKVKHHTDATLLLGELYIYAKRLPEALALFEAAGRDGPLPGKGEFNWGRALAISRRLTEAVGHLRTYVLAHPEDAEALYVFALALEELGSRNEAIAIYERAVKLHPDHQAAGRLKALRGY